MIADDRKFCLEFAPENLKSIDILNLMCLSAVKWVDTRVLGQQHCFGSSSDKASHASLNNGFDKSWLDWFELEKIGVKKFERFYVIRQTENEPYKTIPTKFWRHLLRYFKLYENFTLIN